MEFNSDIKLELDQNILKRLKTRIYLMERENHKTKKYKDNEMLDKIRKVIEAEVDKNDN